jgi:hypothetical protein
MLGAHTWRWVQVLPIRRPPFSTSYILIRVIAAENRIPSVPLQSLADCITNTFSSPLVRDAVFADYNGRRRARVQSAASEARLGHES